MTITCEKCKKRPARLILEIVEDDPFVGTYYQRQYGDRLEIIQADALEYQPPKGVRFDCVWHDIWPTICSDNLEEMKKLHRRYGRKTNWQGSWARDILKAETRRFGWY